MENIWWNQIKKAREFVEEIAEALLDGQSVIVHFPKSIPWATEMHDSLEQILREKNPEYCLLAVDNVDCSIEQAMLESFCRREVRAKYRKNIGVAKFLAALPESTLHSSYVQITVSTESELRAWSGFASEYIQNIPKNSGHGVFCIEAFGLDNIPKVKGLKIIDWDTTISAYDIHTFSALCIAETNISAYLRPYLVELASIVCCDDVELNGACVLHGEAFMLDPGKELRNLSIETARSDGTAFEIAFTVDELQSMIWEAQIRTVFAIIEKYRSYYVHKHEKQISSCLPTTDKDGRIVKNVSDVELGILIKLVGEGLLSISAEEYEQIDFLRQARNELAHLTPISYQNVQKILSLGQRSKFK